MTGRAVAMAMLVVPVFHVLRGPRDECHGGLDETLDLNHCAQPVDHYRRIEILYDMGSSGLSFRGDITLCRALCSRS